MGKKASDGYDYDFKILLIGDTAVGKTCLTMRYGSNLFEENYVLTIGKLTFVCLFWGNFVLRTGRLSFHLVTSSL